MFLKTFFTTTYRPVATKNALSLGWFASRLRKGRKKNTFMKILYGKINFAAKYYSTLVINSN